MSKRSSLDYRRVYESLLPNQNLVSIMARYKGRSGANINALVKTRSKGQFVLMSYWFSVSWQMTAAIKTPQHVRAAVLQFLQLNKQQ